MYKHQRSLPDTHTKRLAFVRVIIADALNKEAQRFIKSFAKAIYPWFIELRAAREALLLGDSKELEFREQASGEQSAFILTEWHNRTDPQKVRSLGHLVALFASKNSGEELTQILAEIASERLVSQDCCCQPA